MIPTRNYIITAIVAFLIGGAFGRFLTPEKVRVETKTVTVEKNIQEDTHKVTTIVKQKDGTTKTVIVDNSVAREQVDSKSTDKVTEKIGTKSLLNISALAGYNYSDTKLVYGASVTKQVMGPISIGLWGLTDKTFGASLGLNF